MPCDASHCEPHGLEKEVSRVASLYDAVVSKRPLNTHHYEGYHPCVYSKGRDRIQVVADDITNRLCTWCKNNDVTKECLELQIWWRDHQAADKAKEDAIKGNGI